MLPTMSVRHRSFISGFDSSHWQLETNQKRLCKQHPGPSPLACSWPGAARHAGGRLVAFFTYPLVSSMSVNVTTIEELMQLNRPQLQTALRLFQQELDGTISVLKQNESARHDDTVLEELSNLLTLRKVVKGRLQELEDLADGSTPLAVAA